MTNTATVGGPSRPRSKHRWLWFLLAAQATVATAWTARSGFFSDDFVWFQVARENGLTRPLLERSAFGHFIPSFHTMNWLFDHFVGASHWEVAVVLIVGWHLCITVMVFLFGRFIQAPRAALMTACGFVAFVPILTSGLIWWGAALCLLTSTACNVAVFCCYGALENGRRWALPAMILAFVAACTFWEKSLMTLPYLALYSIVVSDAGNSLRARIQGFLRRWRIWVALGVPAAIYGSFYLRGHYAAESAATQPTILELVKFLAKAWLRGFWPLVLGLSTPLDGSSVTPWLAILAGQVVAVALVFAAWRWIERGLALVAFFAVVFVINMAVIGNARGGVSTAAIDPRYHFDNVYLLAVCLVSARRRVQREDIASSTFTLPESAGSSRRNHALGLVLVVVLLAVWFRGSARVFQDAPGRYANAYAAEFSSELQRVPVGSAFVDGVVPVRLVPPQMYPYNRFSYVLPQLEDVDFTTNPDRAWFVTNDGSVVLARLSAVVRAEPAEACAGGEGLGQEWLEIALDTTLAIGNWTITIAFDTPAPSSVRIYGRAAPGQAPYPIHGVQESIVVEAGASAVMVIGQYQPISSILLLTEPNQRTCVSEVVVGHLEQK